MDPSFPDVGVIGLVPERWGGEWMSRHQIMTRLSRYFHVVWVNPPRSWRATWIPGRGQKRSTQDQIRCENGMAIYAQSRWLPKFYKPHWLDVFTTRKRLNEARQILRSRGSTKTILYVWRPYFASALDLVEHDVSCYHIVDEYTFSDVELPTAPEEARLIERVNQVFVHSPALMEKKGRINPNTLYVSNGVDFEAFSAENPEPQDLQPVPRPRLGYVGRIKRHLDWDILVDLASRNRKWSFVFVGPVKELYEDKPKMAMLFKMPNVYYLGEKPVSELPRYTGHLDVALLCYKLNDYTKFIYPLKLHEYLASGCPVVGSSIRSFEEFDSVIRIARTGREWVEAISASLEPNARSASLVASRRRIARRHDWNRLVHVIAGALCERLGPVFAAKMPIWGEAESMDR